MATAEESLDPLTDHRRRAEGFRAEAERLESLANRISFGRLAAFLAGAILLGAGLAQGTMWLSMTGGALIVLFAALVVSHARILQARDGAEVRRGVHERHEKRISGAWVELSSTGEGLVEPTHPYASDIDLVGRGSLFQRIDVTRTEGGQRALAGWLGAAATPEEIEARAEAVQELAGAVELRQELEAGGFAASGEQKLDPTPFLQFAQREPYFEGKAWLVPVIYGLPTTTVALFVLGQAGVLSGLWWLLPLLLQVGLSFAGAGACHEAFELVAARRGYVEALQRMLVTLERAELEAPWLRSRQDRLWVEGHPPSRYLRRLDRWAGFAELRHQFPVHLVANWGLLWDLHVLYRLERWSGQIGERTPDVFDALSEVEALSALATLLYIDDSATMPSIGGEEGALDAEALVHPLLTSQTRVPNDVTLPGQGSALIVTGSNMAGKSTLLRAVGLNIALGLAGGPVTARRFRLPLVRLRASMRADDSLQSGASYFHAELQKLRRVTDHAEDDPPVFFLLDELLRGTNARARHLGARAILMHLLERRASGLVATHDVALASLADEYPKRVINVHFTDVMREGEMIFDYRLRPGVVKTSNALRLLRQAGIDVPEDDQLPAQAPPDGTKERPVRDESLPNRASDG